LEEEAAQLVVKEKEQKEWISNKIEMHPCHWG